MEKSKVKGKEQQSSAAMVTVSNELAGYCASLLLSSKWN